MSIKPKISVILTSYNQGKYLDDSLGSMLSQTFQDWECVLIDDGSSDNTQQVAKAFEEKDARIKYFFQGNQGVTAARNLGISLAKGDFIQFLDADDKIHPGKLEYQLNQLDSNPSIDLIYGSSRYFFDAIPEVLYPLHPNGAIPCDLTWKDKFQVEMLMKSNICTNCSLLIRRSVIEKVKFRKSIYEDWIFNVECALNGFVFHFDNSPICYSYIRMTDTSQMMMHSNQLLVGEFQMILIKLVEEFGYVLDRKIICLQPDGFSSKIKNLLRGLTPPLIYSMAASVKRKLF